MAAANHITQERLRSLLHYSPETGVFTRLRSRRGDAVGKVTGCVDKATGYVKIHIEGFLYLAHRLAWIYMHGDCEGMMVDHINMDRADNRIENLRLVNNSQNMHNRLATKASKTGYKGVYITPSTGRFTTKIKIGKKPVSLGTYATPELAYEAYKKAAAELLPDYCRVS